jgi:hypothetical protein
VDIRTNEYESPPKESIKCDRIDQCTFGQIKLRALPANMYAILGTFVFTIWLWNILPRSRDFWLSCCCLFESNVKIFNDNKIAQTTKNIIKRDLWFSKLTDMIYQVKSTPKRRTSLQKYKIRLNIIGQGASGDLMSQ